MDPLKTLIGYSMRSGSTLLQHILAQHSRLRSFSDPSSNWILLPPCFAARFAAP